jgi:hypothetical protein
MKETTAQQLYNKLVNEYRLIGQKGVILFTLNNLAVKVTSKDTVGNMIQEWLREWMIKEDILFEINPSSQTFPDVYLNLKDKKKGLLEIKAFDFNRGAGFDLANFESYCNSLLDYSYRLDSDYLILGYTMTDCEITIKNIWIKKIWELSGGSSTFPIKVQEKKKVIYNIRPINWYSKNTKFKSFSNKEEFLSALNETRYKYSKTHFDNSHWLSQVISNYEVHTGIKLTV